MGEEQTLMKCKFRIAGDPLTVYKIAPQFAQSTGTSWSDEPELDMRMPSVWRGSRQIAIHQFAGTHCA